MYSVTECVDVKETDLSHCREELWTDNTQPTCCGFVLLQRGLPALVLLYNPGNLFKILGPSRGSNGAESRFQSEGSLSRAYWFVVIY